MTMLLLAMLLAVPVDDAAKAPAYPNASLLIEPAELARLLERETFRGSLAILDCREGKARMEGHVPSSHGINPAVWASRFAKDRKAEDWPTFLRLCGINNATRTVVIYDDAMSKDASRIWWILRHHGVEDVRLLNGGWRGWQAAKLPTTKPPAKPDLMAGDSDRSEPLKLKSQAGRHADKTELLGLLQSNPQGRLVIDARSADEHCGKANTAKRNGAIPGARHLEWSDLLDKETHRFKSADQLRKLFAEAGIDLNKPLITYCQSGGRASVMAFALELMGAKDVKNYYASWAEWGNDPNTPIEPGKAKK